MKNFQFNRFMSVAAWDLTINRSFYKKMAVIIFSIILMPVIFKFITILWGVMLHTNTLNELRNIPHEDFYPAISTGYVSSLIPIIIVVSMGYIFHNLLTKQGRINELTLPATNCERFSWHAVRTLIGVPLLIVCATLVADIVQLLLNLIFFHSSGYGVGATIYWVFQSYYTPIQHAAHSSYSLCCVIFGMMLLFFNYFSLFGLGNAWKYRYNIGWTIAWLIALGLIFSIILGLMTGLVFNNQAFFENFVKSIEKNVSEEAAATVFLLVNAAFTALIWWLTYRLYSRAQISTRRNP